MPDEPLYDELPLQWTSDKQQIQKLVNALNKIRTDELPPTVITGLLSAGVNTTLSGSGTEADPYIVDVTPKNLTITRTVYSTPGSYTWNKPTGHVGSFIKVISGGGGACRPANTTEVRIHPGPGIYNEGFFSTASMASSETVDVGAGGTGRTSSAGNGTAGGTSSVGTLIVCTGGSGGQRDNATNVLEGTATGGSLPRAGKNFDDATALNITGADAFQCYHDGIDLPPFGMGGRRGIGVAGNPATGYGASGGTSTGAFNGGNGAGGLVIIDDYVFV